VDRIRANFLGCFDKDIDIQVAFRSFGGSNKNGFISVPGM
jgi:hypothetical protein